MTILKVFYKEFQKNSKRIPIELQKNSKRIPENKSQKITRNSEKKSKKISKNCQKIPQIFENIQLLLEAENLFGLVFSKKSIKIEFQHSFGFKKTALDKIRRYRTACLYMKQVCIRLTNLQFH